MTRTAPAVRTTIALALTLGTSSWLILWASHAPAVAPSASRRSTPQRGCEERYVFDHLDARGEPSPDWTVARLTAYRRQRDEPDPLAIEIAGDCRIELPFPELPLFEVRLRNVDRGGSPFLIECGPYGPSFWGFRARLDMEPEWTLSPRSVFYKTRGRETFVLNSGEVLRVESQTSEGIQIPLVHYGYPEVPRPGPVRFRLEYGLGERFFEHEPHPGCGSLALSPTLEFEWTPVHVVSDPSVNEDVRRLLEEMGKTPGVEVRSPTSGLLEAWGVAALPALFELLDEAAEDPPRRAEILVALHLATGLLDPTSRRYANDPAGPLGHYLLEPRPGWRSESDDGGPAPDAQEALVERWDGLHSLVVVVD